MKEKEYLKIKHLFEKNQNAQRAEKMSAYMRNKFLFYGILTPKRREIYKEFLKNEKKKKSVDWNFLYLCWSDEYREFQYLVTDYLKNMSHLLVFEDINKIFKFIKTKQWWDTIDNLDRIVGKIALTDKRGNALMLEWSKNEDFWVRRVAIDHQLCRKEKTDPELLEHIIVNNFGSNEFFINKAIGWSLREYAKTNPQWVKDFLQKYNSKLDKLSIREAGKHL